MCVCVLLGWRDKLRSGIESTADLSRRIRNYVQTKCWKYKYNLIAHSRCWYLYIFIYLHTNAMVNGWHTIIINVINISAITPSSQSERKVLLHKLALCRLRWKSNAYQAQYIFTSEYNCVLLLCGMRVGTVERKKHWYEFNPLQNGVQTIRYLIQVHEMNTNTCLSDCLLFFFPISLLIQFCLPPPPQSPYLFLSLFLSTILYVHMHCCGKKYRLKWQIWK